LPERRGRRRKQLLENLNPLTPNDHNSGRTASLTSKRCILYIYSTNIGTEYFKHDIHTPFFSFSKCSLFHNSNLLVPVLFTFYIQCVLKLKKNNSGAKRLTFTFYIQSVLKLKKNNSGAKRLTFTFYIQCVLKFKKNNSGAKRLTF